MELILSGLGKGANMAFQSAVYGNMKEVKNLVDKQVIDMQIDLDNETLYGNHIGTRKIVKKGSMFQIKCFSLKPEYVVQAFGHGQFICDDFTYEGNFNKGCFHDNTGNAVFSLGETERYIGMFKNGLRQGVGKMQAYDAVKKDWITVEEGLFQQNKFVVIETKNNKKQNKVQSIDNKTKENRVAPMISQPIISQPNTQSKKQIIKSLLDEDFPKEFQTKKYDQLSQLKQHLDFQEKNFVKKSDDLKLLDFIEINIDQKKLNKNDLKTIAQSLKFCIKTQYIKLIFSQVEFQEDNLLFLQFLDQLPELKCLKLVLKKTKLNNQQMEYLDEIQNLKNLKGLFICIEQLELQKQLQKNIINGISNLNDLTHLFLHFENSKILKSNHELLFNSLSNHNLEILSVNLNQSKLSVENIELFCQQIKNQNNLKDLKIQFYSCQLQSESADLICDTIENMNLNDLQLFMHGNKLEKDQIEKLTDQMKDKKIAHKTVNL